MKDDPPIPTTPGAGRLISIIRLRSECWDRKNANLRGCGHGAEPFGRTDQWGKHFVAYVRGAQLIPQLPN